MCRCFNEGNLTLFTVANPAGTEISWPSLRPPHRPGCAPQNCDLLQFLTRRRLGVYHQGIGTSPSCASAPMLPLASRPSAIVCFGTTVASWSTSAKLCAESAGLSRRPLLLLLASTVSCASSDAAGFRATLLICSPAPCCAVGSCIRGRECVCDMAASCPAAAELAFSNIAHQ